MAARTRTPAKQAFGKLVRRLRESRGLLQVDFAIRLSVSRQTLSAIETGKQAPKWALVQRLMEEAPDAAAEIAYAYKSVADERAQLPEPDRQLSAALGEFRRRAESLIRRRKYREATSLLRAALDIGIMWDVLDRRQPDLRFVVWLYERLSDIQYLDGDRGVALYGYDLTLSLARAARLEPEEVRLADELADRLAERWEYDIALDVVDNALGRARDAARLWYKRGIVLSHTGRYVDASASFITALKTGLKPHEGVTALGETLWLAGDIAGAADAFGSVPIEDVDGLREFYLELAEAQAHEASFERPALLAAVDERLQQMTAGNDLPDLQLPKYLLAECFSKGGGDRERIVLLLKEILEQARLESGEFERPSLGETLWTRIVQMFADVGEADLAQQARSLAEGVLPAIPRTLPSELAIHLRTSHGIEFIDPRGIRELQAGGEILSEGVLERLALGEQRADNSVYGT
jgi:DNA-binding XRE family transcriptional regulator